MIIPVIALWALTAPAGYLAGDVYATKNRVGQSILPFLAAAFPPLAMVLAMVVITQTQGEIE